MKVFELIFQMGILFSAFAFLWFWIQLLLVFVIPVSIRLPLRYFLQLLHSLFLGTLVLKFLQMENPPLNFNGYLALGMMTYFLYLIRNIRSRSARMRVEVYSNIYSKLKTKNEWEWTLAFISLAITSLGMFYPQAFESQTTLWFYQQTQSLMNTPILGWIFKLFGFFFLLGTLFRFTGALLWLVSPKRNQAPRDDERFDEFEEL
ncbi:MAG: hypothetical protein EBS17_07635 [Flavobacteriia bacterium]|nr:hypothetical protein [Flavobacteriia bacterium]